MDFETILIFILAVLCIVLIGSGLVRPDISSDFINAATQQCEEYEGLESINPDMWTNHVACKDETMFYSFDPEYIKVKVKKDDGKED